MLKKSITVLIVFLFLALVNLCAQAPIRPALPQKTVSLALPTQGTSTCPTLPTGSNCIRNVPPGDATSFQSAINAATCGDTIVLAAGSTYSGNFTIPQTTCTNNSGWIEIQSSAMGSLPSPGNRVGPSNISNMPTISTPNTAPAITFNQQSNHWRLMGLEITTSYVSTLATVYNLILSGVDGEGHGLTSAPLLPSYLILDRVYLHGLAATNTTRGMDMDGVSVGVVDSYCDEIHSNGNDAQCFGSWNGAGPFLFQNNFIQASAENIMFGGADPAIANLVPSDITIIGNLIQKNTAWRGAPAPYNWVVKNLFELKNAQRVLLDGNVFQYTWASAQDEVMIIRSVNQNGSCPWCVVQDVTITHNLMLHAPIGVVLAPSQGPQTTNPAVPTQRVLIQNNFFADISSVNWGGHGWVYQVISDSTVPTMHDIILDHNTSFEDSTNGAVMAFGDTGTVNNLQITNLISDQGAYGIFGSGTAQGTSTLTTYTKNLVYGANVLLNAIGVSRVTYPAGTYWNTLAGVEFISYSGTDPTLPGNLQLQSTSRYHNAGTDGKDIGVWDWACLNNDSAAALVGNFVPSSGCGSSGNLLLQPPTTLNAVVR